MNVDEYRKAYAAQIDKVKASAPGSNELVLMSKSVGGAGGPGGLAEEIAVFADSSKPADVRITALRNVQTATFLGPGFDRYRAAFRNALRAVASEDKNQELRTRALEILALDKDDVARQLLLKGFEDPEKALVSVAKAVQLLANDDHGVAIPLAHKVVAGKYAVDAKEEALRVLASDPGAGSLFAGILSDRSQPEQLRSVSASGLREVDPQQFEQVAQGIVVDAQEDDEVRANCLGALNHLQGYSAKVNPGFADALSKLDLTGKSDGLRTAAARYLQTRPLK
jgi:hypothetical protein